MLPHKYISIEQSKLYKIGRKKDLAAMLDVSLPELISLTSDNNFKEWIKEQKGKNRVIEQPNDTLKFVLSKLHYILRRVETPYWLLSGKKKIKPRDNADAHSQNQFMMTVDIEGFYQSTKREYIYSTFKNIFGQIDDVASLLADLVTYKGHIPTGAATSQLIAFWAYKQTFDRIYKLCVANDIIMTVWVDDITFSSTKNLPKNWHKDIQKIVQEVQLSLKTKKTKTYSSKEYKSVTGSAISPDGEIRIKNVKRKEIVDLINGKVIESLSLKEAKSVFGKLVSQRQNENNFFDGVYFRLKKHIRHLEKSSSNARKMKRASQ